ncbi:MAG TPA: hypothetical protein DDZ91_14475 [Firmicutes bacterium]|jgi:hypothetical protein|nr:hypothetical protein [Bacillota bacterium]
MAKQHKRRSGKKEAKEIARRYLVDRADKAVIPLWSIASVVENKIGRELYNSLFGYEDLLPTGTKIGWFDTSNLQSLCPGDIYCVINPFYSKSIPPRALTMSPVGHLTAAEYHDSWF